MPALISIQVNSLFKDNDMKRLLVLCGVMLCAFSFVACDNDDDEYIGEPYDATLTIQPECGIEGIAASSYFVQPCIYATNDKGDTVNVFSLREINGFDYEEGNKYVVRIHATPNKKEAVWGDAPAYQYSLTKVISKTFVGINTTGVHRETYRLHWQETNGSDFPHFDATNVKTGESTIFAYGEIIGFNPAINDPNSTPTDTTVTVDVYPRSEPTNRISNHKALYRIVK